MPLWKRATPSDRFFFACSLALLVSAIFIVGMRDRRIHAAGDDEEFYRFVDVAAEIYSEVSSKYVEDVDSRELLEAALSGMFRVLDDHSQYMTPSMLQSLEKDTSGEFGGIGIHISMRQGVLTVISPIPGTPAAEAGLQPWDRIVEIEGDSTRGMVVQDAVEMLTGPPGTDVTFQVFREGERDLLEFTLTRAIVEVESVHSAMLEDGIGYVRLSRFSENTSRNMRRAVMEMKGEGAKALILDMRYNSGGLLREAIEVCDMFLDKGELIVSTKGRLRSQNNEFRAESDPVISLPVFVLVNEGSASASEIVAGCLQDHHIGVIIGPAGKNTFGKGSVQTISNLQHSMAEDENGNTLRSAMRLTTALYYTPSGRTIHEVGITPDIGVPLTRKHELELQRHGLIGDVFTGEDYRVDEELLEGAPAGDNEPEGNGVRLQRDANREEAPADDPDKPFYAVESPQLIDDDEFVDIMLEEAVKQLKIYMILEGSRTREAARSVAAAGSAEDLSMAK